MSSDDENLALGPQIPGAAVAYTRASSGARVGYTRVSTVAQTLDQQNAALAAAGVTKTFSDTLSGARDDRPGLAALMEYVREGDTVVVWKLDRLGRNTLHILETVKALTDRGVTLVSTSDGIDSNTAADPAHVATARRMKADGHTARDAARYLGVSRATLYRYLADEAA